MNAITYDGFGYFKYMFYSREEIRRRAKARALKNGSDYFWIDFGFGPVEGYERHGTRWFRMRED